MTTGRQYRNLSEYVSSLGSEQRRRGRAGMRGGRLFVSAVDAGEHLVPQLAEPVEIGVGQVLEEVPAHAVEVRPAGRGELVAARVGEHGERAAPVGLAGLAPDVALALEAVDQARQPAA